MCNHLLELLPTAPLKASHYGWWIVIPSHPCPSFLPLLFPFLLCSSFQLYLPYLVSELVSHSVWVFHWAPRPLISFFFLLPYHVNLWLVAVDERDRRCAWRLLGYTREGLLRRLILQLASVSRPISTITTEGAGEIWFSSKLLDESIAFKIPKQYRSLSIVYTVLFTNSPQPHL